MSNHHVTLNQQAQMFALKRSPAWKVFLTVYPGSEINNCASSTPVLSGSMFEPDYAGPLRQ